MRYNKFDLLAGATLIGALIGVAVLLIGGMAWLIMRALGG